MGGLDYQIDDATEVGDRLRLIPCFCEPIVYRTPLEPPVELTHLHGNHSPVLSFAIFSAPLGLGTWLYTN